MGAVIPVGRRLGEHGLAVKRILPSLPADHVHVGERAHRAIDRAHHGLHALGARRCRIASAPERLGIDVKLPTHGGNGAQRQQEGIAEHEPSELHRALAIRSPGAGLGARLLETVRDRIEKLGVGGHLAVVENRAGKSLEEQCRSHTGNVLGRRERGRVRPHHEDGDADEEHAREHDGENHCLHEHDANPSTAHTRDCKSPFRICRAVAPLPALR